MTPESSRLHYPCEGLDEEVIAPHDALVHTELLPLVVRAVFEQALPGVLMSDELRLAQPGDGRFGVRMVAARQLLVFHEAGEHDQSISGARGRGGFPAAQRVRFVEVVWWHRI